MSSTECWSEKIDFLNNVIRQRERMDSHLPVNFNLLNLDLLVLVLQKNYSKESLTYKFIFHSLNYSKNTIRAKINILEQDGWIEIVKNTNDERFKIISPTKKLLDAFEMMLQNNLAGGS